MKSHGKSKAVIAAVIFEVNLLQSSRFGECLRLCKEKMDAKNVYLTNPAFDRPTPHARTTGMAKG